MKKSDDYSLTPEQYSNVLKEAERRLREADAFGRFPTPVDDILEAAEVFLAPENILDQGFLEKIRYKATKVLKSAIEKVWGLFDATARLIFIDSSVLPVKQTFLKLHETAHASLPHQNKIFSLFEDCKRSLEPETSELFDREANVFATEVLFQLGQFEQEAASFDFSINTPIKLSKRYGASVYASVRRYVQRNEKNCAVIVLNPAQFLPNGKHVAEVRRCISSPTFQKQFGQCFPDSFTSDDQIGALIPVIRKMSKPQEIRLVDKNGDEHVCVAEGFNTTYQIFVLIHEKKNLATSKTLFISNPEKPLIRLTKTGV